MKDLFLRFGIMMGKRYRQKDKLLFLNELVIDMKAMGYSVDFQVIKKHFEKAVNLYVGNTKKAKTIFVIAYDTPTKLLGFMRNYYPFETKKNYQTEITNLLVHYTIAILLLMVAFIIARPFLTYSSGMKIASVTGILIAIIGAIYFMSGVANRVNYQRNSAAVVMAHLLANSFKDKEHVGFAFLDRGVNSLQGYQYCKEYFSDSINQYQFIILDGLAMGESLVIAHSEQNRFLAHEMIEAYSGINIIDKNFSESFIQQMILSLFPNSLHISLGKIKEGHFVIENTRHNSDHKIDFNQFEIIENMLKKFAQKQ